MRFTPTGIFLFCIGLAAPAGAAEVVVNVSGMTSAEGQIGCALFAGPEGFPMDNAKAQVQWRPADPGGVTCRFVDVPDGTHAVAVSADLNGNRKLDTNILGIPKEPWGVSNNVRPRLRAPRFEEAAFTVSSGRDTTIDVKLAR